MNCRCFEKDLTDCARGRKEAGPELRDHLKNCPKCCALLESERQLTAALASLRHIDQTMGAPAKIEQALIAGFQEAARSGGLSAPALRFARTWMVKAAAAVAVITLSAVTLLHIKQTPSPLMHSPANAAPTTTNLEAGEITSDFIPLIHGELSGNNVQVVRVKLPRSSLLQFGLPLNMERADELIDAEVIVGEEGLPHAIRFIQQSNSSIYQEEK